MAQTLEDQKEHYAKIITTEVGKPITQSLVEIDFCIRHLNYYVNNAESFMEDEDIRMMNG